MNDKHYQGKPCRYGHSGVRYKSTRYCVDCNYDKSKRWAQSEYAKAYMSKKHIYNTYRLTDEQFNRMFAECERLCSICKVPMVVGGRKSNSVCVDHDHITGEIRGLLCNNCNRAIGLFFDNKNILLSAVKYLEE